MTVKVWLDDGTELVGILFAMSKQFFRIKCKDGEYYLNAQHVVKYCWLGEEIVVEKPL